MPKPKTKKQFYHLIAGIIMFRDPEGAEDEIGQITLNALIQTNDNLIRHRQLGQAQQALQLLFFKKIGDEKLQVVDCVIINISSLGYMTEEEFQVPPPGMTLEQAAPETIDSITRNLAN